MNILPKNLNFNFIAYSKSAFKISTIFIITGIIFFSINGIKTSIDFTGGTVINFNVKKDSYDPEFNLRSYLKENLDQSVSLVEMNSKDGLHRVVITTQFLKDEGLVNTVLKKKYGDGYVIEKIESIGPKIGKELKNNSLKAIVVAMLLIGIYITFRFDSYYALGSIIALFHDIAITLSFLIFFQYEISISIIAALLTILGYSLNDTIVIYDRIRENMNLNIDGIDRKIVANNSLNSTLNRTVITSLTTLIVAGVLFVLGGQVLQPFAMALIIGVLTGTYSSLFIATPLMLILEKKYKLKDFEEE